MVSWAIVGVTLLLVAMLSAWALPAGALPRRFAIVAIGCAGCILSLGLYWQPSLAALVRIAEAKRYISLAPAPVACPDAARTLALVEKMSRGLIKISPEGEVKLPEQVWGRLGEPERAGILRVATETTRCLNPGTEGSVRVVDSDTGALLHRTAPFG